MAVLALWGMQQLWFLVSTQLPLSLPGTRLSRERMAHSVAQSSTSHKMNKSLSCSQSWWSLLASSYPECMQTHLCTLDD